MCGINGIVKFDEEVQEKEIKIMNFKIAHRGPDDEGVFVDKKVGFGHRRLKILDLSEKGHQPMEYEYKGQKFVIVFNGEIYNFKEIKNELQRKGHSFVSNTDTEVILASYVEYGAGCLRYFNGMFAFVIYDLENNILFGARDRFGKKPLKYYLDGKRFIFSSELKAILVNDIKREVDFEAINDFLTLQYVPAPKTGFKNIYKLKSAHYFIFDLKNKQLEIKKYFDLDYLQKKKISKKEWIVLIESKLKEAVQKRMVSDVPLGAFLSGGVDSSAVVSMMSKLSQERIKTFSISFDEKDFDESKYAWQISKMYNTEHTEFKVKAADLLEHIDGLVYQYEEPFADASALPTFLLSRLAKQYVTVALSGDGGDECFGGYDKYRIHLIVLKYKWIFKVLKIFEHFIKSKRLNILLKTLDMDIEQRHYNFTNYFDEWSKERMFCHPEQYTCHPEFISGSQESTNKQDILKQVQNDNQIDSIFHLDFTSYIPDDINTKVDIASMANGLEVRAPFLDYELAELAAQMPYDLKLDCWQGKKILKEALQKYLPNDVLYRKKHGFSVPLEDWFQNELKNQVKDVILNKNGLVLQIMKEDEVKSLIERHLAGENNAKKIWALFVLNIWHKKYIVEYV